MSIQFTVASTNYLIHSAAALTAAPLTFAGWCKVDATSATAQTPAMLGVNGSVDNSFRLLVNPSGGSPANTFGFATRTTTNAQCFAASAITAGQWHHVAGVTASATSRFCYMDGTAGTENTTSRTPSGIDRTVFAATSVPSLYLGGLLAEWGLWSVALTAAEIASLADGYSPLFVRPQSLVGYWPLIGRYSPEIDLRGRFEMTWTNTPTVAVHPRIFYPTKQQVLVADAVVGGDAVPQVWSQYRRRHAG